MAKRKFYKTRIVYEVLSEEPLPEMSLADIHYFCTEGEGVGRFGTEKVKVLDSKAAAKALVEFGSDPSFFQLK